MVGLSGKLTPINAFLHALLSEEVFMIQPPRWMVSSDRLTQVCKLKVLHGLEQGPRAWFDMLGSFLHSLGFENPKGDSSLLVYHKNECLKNHSRHALRQDDNFMPQGLCLEYIKERRNPLCPHL